MVDVSLCCLKLYTEIPVILLFYSFLLCDPVNKNFVIYRICYVTLGYNESDCSKLGGKNISPATAALEKIVEPHANIILMTSSLIMQIMPALLCLFIGPWSDKNGRKPVMIFSLLGFVIGSIIQAIISAIPTLSPWFIITSSVPIILCGGFAPFLMIVLCYITDVTNQENRGLRIGMFEATIALGMIAGTLSSSYLFDAIGYTGVFEVSAFCHFLALLYVVFLIPESVVASENQEDSSIFSLSNVKDMFKTTFKRRENNQRSLLLLTILLAALYLLASTADSSVIFLYLRESFDWSLEQYTLYSSVRSACWIVGTFFGVYVMHKLLHVNETILIFIGVSVYFFSMILQGLAVTSWQIYAAGGIRCVGGVISPMIRSLISKIITPDEIGKVFSLTITLECLTGIIGSPVYTFIYNGTISNMPGLFNFVTAGVLGIAVILIIAIIVIQRRIQGNQYRIVENTNEC